jgi:hypothetical protein
MEYQMDRVIMRRLPVQSDGKICPPVPDSAKKCTLRQLPLHNMLC